MLFSSFALYLQKLEQTTLRNEITSVLADLFKKAGADEIDKICYLSLGRLAPLFEPIEFNIAEKMMIKILSRMFSVDEKKVLNKFKQIGDLGEVAFKSSKFPPERRTGAVQSSKLTINQVFDQLLEIAQASGTGSQEQKINLFSQLIKKLDPLSVKYIVRIPLGKMRLGFSDLTILDALSWMEADDKSLRPQLEGAYNISSDIGLIAKVFKAKGLSGIEKIKLTPGIPLRAARCERLPTAEEVVKKLGKCAVQPKFDGLRVQIHLFKFKAQNSKFKTQKGFLDDKTRQKKEVRIFSRNLEDITHMFPEVVEAALKLPYQSLVLDGEALSYNADTGEFVVFQEASQRRRKYDIEKKAKELPLKVFLFDVLYVDSRNVLAKEYKKRRKILEDIVNRRLQTQKRRKSRNAEGYNQQSANNEVFVLTPEIIVDDAKKLGDFFERQIAAGLEGVVVKKLHASYRAGVRDFTWVKFKREEKGTLEDTVDCVLMGYYMGQGKRTSFGIGVFLGGVYDNKEDCYKTIAKIGSGPSDDEWKQLQAQASRLRVKNKPALYQVNKALACDVWVEPKIVVAIRGNEITKSPVHSCGYALRFPRLMKIREDKGPQEATTVKEAIKLYNDQKVIKSQEHKITKS